MGENQADNSDALESPRGWLQDSFERLMPIREYRALTTAALFHHALFI